MYAWAGAASCGLAPVDVGPVLQDLSTGTELSLFVVFPPPLQPRLCRSCPRVECDRLETNTLWKKMFAQVCSDCRANNMTYLPAPHLFWQNSLSVDSLTCTSPAIHTFLPLSFHFYQVGMSREKPGLRLHYLKSKPCRQTVRLYAYVLFISPWGQPQLQQ